MKKYIRQSMLGLLGVCVIFGIAVFCSKQHSNHNVDNGSGGNVDDGGGDGNNQPNVPSNEATLSIEENESSDLIFKLPNTSQYLIIKNTSNAVVAFNVKAILSEELIAAGVKEEPEPECANLPPQNSCRINFSVSTKPFNKSDFYIKGDNTNEIESFLTFIQQTVKGTWYYYKKSPTEDRMIIDDSMTIGEKHCDAPFPCMVDIKAKTFSGPFQISNDGLTIFMWNGDITYNPNKDTIFYKNEYVRAGSPPPPLPEKTPAEYFSQTFVRTENGREYGISIKHIDNGFSGNYDIVEQSGGLPEENCSGSSVYHFRFTYSVDYQNKNLIKVSGSFVQYDLLYEFAATADKTTKTLTVIKSLIAFNDHLDDPKYGRTPIRCAPVGAQYQLK